MFISKDPIAWQYIISQWGMEDEMWSQILRLVAVSGDSFRAHSLLNLGGFGTASKRLLQLHWYKAIDWVNMLQSGYHSPHLDVMMTDDDGDDDDGGEGYAASH